MKKLSSLFVLFLVSILLSGCISIPLGDSGKLEISGDGVTLNAGEEIVDEDIAVKKEDEDSDVNKEDEDENAIEETSDEDDKDKSDDKKAVSKSEDTNTCENDYEDLQEIMPENIYMPDCATDITAQSRSDETRIRNDATYIIEGSWKDFHTQYKNFLEEEGFVIYSEEKDPTNKKGTLGAKKDKSTLETWVKENDEGSVFIELRYIIREEVD